MTSASTYDVEAVRATFPILRRTVHGGKPLVYLDHAATAQKPQAVIDAIDHYYRTTNSNVHRGAHALSTEATAAFEDARTVVASFIGASRTEEIVFTSGTTDGLNLLATTVLASATPGDEILLTEMEHHANIVPWQMVAQQRGLAIRVVPVRDDGTISVDDVASLLTERTKVFACTHVSNVLGTINPIAEWSALCRANGTRCIVDGAQAIQHCEVDVQSLGCDAYVFSAHKLFGPTGFGVLWARYDVLDALPPYRGGGAMIDRVSFTGTTYNAVPMRFEAGTPHIEGAVGTAAAIRWLQTIDTAARIDHEEKLLHHATMAVSAMDGLTILGTAKHKVGIISFVVDGVHASDIGTLLDNMGIAVRAGHHCTQPLHQRFGIAASARASFALTSTREEVDMLVDGLSKAIRMLR